MTTKRDSFVSESKNACENTQKKEILHRNLSHFYKKWEIGRSQFSDIQLAGKKIHFAKFKSIENLEKNLSEFESKFKARGGNIFYANDQTNVYKYILQLAKDVDCKKVVKSKSMVCEEIELEKFLNDNGISVLETDLGEFIVQIAGEKPSHITAPALHKSKIEIYDLLNSKLNQSFDNKTSTETVVGFVRNLLREEYAKAQIGITGCNFMIADVGAIAITENEANAILSATFPKVHVIITTIEKLIYSLDNLELFQTMLSSHGTGQKITAYNHLIFGPAQNKEQNGPEQIHLILLNNSRTSIIKDVNMRQAAYCIKCGACHNFCPVYKQIGGHSYLSAYNGPIGSVISPYIFGEEEYSFLPFASTLCGKCDDVCPVQINLTTLLVNSRNNIIRKKLNLSSERKIFHFVNKKLLKRSRMDRYSPFLKNTAIRFFLKKSWGIHREIPTFAAKSFNKIKKEK
jgi:L-lactate dehydrogenase complex protein LldF